MLLYLGLARSFFFPFHVSIGFSRFLKSSISLPFNGWSPEPPYAFCPTRTHVEVLLPQRHSFEVACTFLVKPLATSPRLANSRAPSSPFSFSKPFIGSHLRLPPRVHLPLFPTKLGPPNTSVRRHLHGPSHASRSARPKQSFFAPPLPFLTPCLSARRFWMSVPPFCLIVQVDKFLLTTGGGPN